VRLDSLSRGFVHDDEDVDECSKIYGLFVDRGMTLDVNSLLQGKSSSISGAVSSLSSKSTIYTVRLNGLGRSEL
jgi:hypothetical protein